MTFRENGTPAEPLRYEVLALRYGTRTTRKSEVFLSFGVYQEPDAALEMDYYFWVARNAERTVVIDCGFNERSGAGRQRTMLCPPAGALRRVGVDPDSVDQLVVTHAHYDHIGNLPAFPRARVVMADREFRFLTSPAGGKPLFMSLAEPADLGLLAGLSAAGRVDLVRGRANVAPGIEVVEIGGHTPGQLAVLVAAERGDLVIASDTLHYYEEMEADRPFAHATDIPGMYAGYSWLRAQAGSGREIIASHDPVVAERYPAVPGTGGLAVRIG